jgi:NTP pyrophosphatase (non-canonical NTP hydrolase)
MDSDTYQRLSARTDHPNYALIRERLQPERTLMILHALMGVVTEAGEMMDALKKHLIYGKSLDRVNLIEEGGDTHWYESLLYRALESSFDDAMERNIAKLQQRYPHMFTEETALTRDLDKERRVLEGVETLNWVSDEAKAMADRGPSVVSMKVSIEGDPTASYPNPTEADLKDPLFSAIWQAIKTWDLNRGVQPDQEGGGFQSLYSGATGNDVMHILSAIRAHNDSLINKLKHDIESEE